MAKAMNRLATAFIAVAMAISFVPILGFQDAYADEGATALSGDALNGLKVRIRPADSYAPLSVNQDGYGSQNCVHIFNQGKSSQFYLERADDDSYVVYFYTHYRDAAHKTSGDCRLDIDNGEAALDIIRKDR